MTTQTTYNILSKALKSHCPRQNNGLNFEVPKREAKYQHMFSIPNQKTYTSK